MKRNQRHCQTLLSICLQPLLFLSLYDASFAQHQFTSAALLPDIMIHL